MTSPRHQLDHARQRVHTLLGMIAELESRSPSNTALLTAAQRGLREASRELCDAVYAALHTTALAGSLGPVDVVLDRLPALERWRRLAVANTARRSPLEVAAAHELTGLKLALTGDRAGAEREFAAAAAVADTRAAS